MRKPLLYLLFCGVSLSCTKETVEEYVIVPAPAAPTIQIKVDQVVDDSTIVLKWTKYKGDGFRKYRLVRTAIYMRNGVFDNYSEPVDSSSDINNVRFTERKMPLARELSYDLYVVTDAQQSPSQQLADRAIYNRPNSLVYGIPTDVLISKTMQRLFIAESKKITAVDYTGKVRAAKDFPVSFGFCSLGSFEGSNELYVPLNDGWLHILDAATLELKDRIYVAGDVIGSVVATNGNLYVSSSDRSAGGFANCVKVYDRGAKTLVGRTGYWDNTRLVPLEGSSVELIDLSINLSPTSLSHYQFTGAGIPVAKKEDPYHGSYTMDASIVRSFPDGNRFITSSSGTIFNKSLVFEQYLQPGGPFSDFAFGDAGAIVYAAHAAEKKIAAIDVSAASVVRSYTTGLYPYKIFRDGKTLICVGKTYADQQFTYLLVEKVDL